MPRRQATLAAFLLVCLVAFTATSLCLQPPAADQVQITPATVRAIEPPAPDATAEQLEHRGDELRAEKDYLDSLDYYHAALTKHPNCASVFNKMGIAELLIQRYSEAKKSFERAIKADHNFADAYNNLGVIFYIGKKYSRAIDRYNKAIELRADAASYYSNLGAALFSKKEFEKSVVAYSRALEIDPDVFERTSKAGIAAQMSRPEDRAHYDYVVARLYAKMGEADRSLEYLRKAMEEGYKSIDNVYKDEEFAGLRKDKRFTDLMSARPPAITD